VDGAPLFSDGSLPSPSPLPFMAARPQPRAQDSLELPDAMVRPCLLPGEFQAMKIFALRAAARHATLTGKPNYLFLFAFF